MYKMSILRGVPGSGKSTWAENAQLSQPDEVVIVSADSFFVGSDGVYRFDYTKLGKAHERCFRSAACYVVRPWQMPDNSLHLIIDNTNTTAIEMAPYVALANAFSMDLEILFFDVDSKIAHARNKHGVPLESVVRMVDRIRRSMDDMPPWWKPYCRTISAG